MAAYPTAAYPRERARYGPYGGNFQGGSFYIEAKSQKSIRLFSSEGDIERKLNTSEEQDSPRDFWDLASK